jgi:hypothetical protein
MIRILSLIALLAVILAALTSCDKPAAAGSASDSPTEAYKRLFNAVKSKNTDAIKAEMTEATIQFAEMVSQRNNTPIEKVFENGFTATTFASKLPTIRDERIADDMGAVEVWNSKESKWEDLPFIKENGAWKLAVGDLFKGSYKSPGPGRDRLEKEAANAAGQGPVQMPVPDINANIPANLMPANAANAAKSANAAANASATKKVGK